MLSLPVYPLHPSASLGGYEWRAWELEAQLTAACEADKPAIRSQLATVVSNFHRTNPGRQLVPTPSPFILY